MGQGQQQEAGKGLNKFFGVVMAVYLLYSAFSNEGVYAFDLEGAKEILVPIIIGTVAVVFAYSMYTVITRYNIPWIVAFAILFGGAAIRAYTGWVIDGDSLTAGHELKGAIEDSLILMGFILVFIGGAMIDVIISAFKRHQ